MAMLKAVLLAAILLATTPALAQQAGDPVDMDMVGGWPALAPGVPQIQTAMDTLDACDPGRQCSPRRRYVIHAVTCKPIGRRGEHWTAACRMDMTRTDTAPEYEEKRFRDQCGRFEIVAGGRWAVARNWDPPCEVPSMLKRDPHPRPERKHLEAAAVSAAQCYDGETFDCFNYSKSAKLTASSCRPQPEREPGRPRFVCLISGTVFYTSARPQRFTDLCVRIKRYSIPGESQPFWGTDYEESDPTCEADWAKRR